LCSIPRPLAVAFARRAEAGQWVACPASRPADGIYNGTYAIVTTDQSPPITMVAPTASNVTLGVVGDSKTRVARHALFASVGEVLDSLATNSVKADWLYV